MAGEGTAHRLGWLGTGRMGTELARRLLAADCDVAVYNRTRAKADTRTRTSAITCSRAR